MVSWLKAEKCNYLIFITLVKCLDTIFRIEYNEYVNQLKNKLSEYMMPRIIIIKDRLPINKNGKIDRQLLKEDI